jgi:hypothetical protein
MFVRWNRRERKGRGKPKADALYAVLVESTRVNGKPRQKTIKYLGWLPLDLGSASREVTHFWITVDRAIEELKLPGTEREKILASLAKVAPARKAKVEKEALERERASLAALGEETGLEELAKRISGMTMANSEET